MPTNHIKRLSLLVFISVWALSFGAPSDTFALTVSPAKFEIAGDPGSTLVGTVELYNERSVNQRVYTSFENFESNDDSGTPRFVGATEGLATWMSAQPEYTLAPNERISVNYTIVIPESAEPGGYFAAMFFGTQPPVGEGQVSIGGRLGVLMLLRVNGEITEAGGILDFGITEKKPFYTLPPLELSYRFSNDGADRVLPMGEMRMKNTFGMVRHTLDANPREGSVLPRSIRKFTNVWELEGEEPTDFFGIVRAQWNQFHFGWYTADLNLQWGETNKESAAAYSFFMFPWQLLVCLLGILLVVGGTFKLIGRSYRASLIREFKKQLEEGMTDEPEKEVTQEGEEKPIIEIKRRKKNRI